MLDVILNIAKNNFIWPLFYYEVRGKWQKKINYIESMNMYERCLETSSFEFATMFTYFKAFQAFNKLKHREIGHS